MHVSVSGIPGNQHRQDDHSWLLQFKAPGVSGLTVLSLNDAGTRKTSVPCCALLRSCSAESGRSRQPLAACRKAVTHVLRTTARWDRLCRYYILLLSPAKGRRWFSEMCACTQQDVGQDRETLWYASGLYGGERVCFGNSRDLSITWKVLIM